MAQGKDQLKVLVNMATNIQVPQNAGISCLDKDLLGFQGLLHVVR
jgi:hypothetical protein